MVLLSLFECVFILIHDLVYNDQTLNDSPLYVIWVAGLEVQMMTCMRKFPVRLKKQGRRIMSRGPMVVLIHNCHKPIYIYIYIINLLGS
jgi:hypothetical protein